MSNWYQIFYDEIYNNEYIKEFTTINDFPENIFGFIYCIRNKETNKIYVGKKQIMSNINKKLGKKEIALLPIQRGRKVTKKKITKESDWVNYWGSSKPLLKEINEIGKDKFEREILLIVNTKKELTYWELAYQIKYDVLRVNSFNESVLGRYFTKDFKYD